MNIRSNKVDLVNEIYRSDIEPLYNEIDQIIKKIPSNSKCINEKNYYDIKDLVELLSTKITIFSEKILEFTPYVSNNISKSIDKVFRFINESSPALSASAFKSEITSKLTESKYILLNEIAEKQDKINLEFSQKNNPQISMEEVVTNALKPFMTLFSNFFAELNSALLKLAIAQNKELPKPETKSEISPFFSKKS